MIGNKEDLHEIRSTLDVCPKGPEKYIVEVLLPIVNFRRHRAFDDMAIREFYSLLNAINMGANSVGLRNMLVRLKQSLATITGRIPAVDC
jgi:hypothetical protein